MNGSAVHRRRRSRICSHRYGSSSRGSPRVISCHSAAVNSDAHSVVSSGLQDGDRHIDQTTTEPSGRTLWWHGTVLPSGRLPYTQKPVLVGSPNAPSLITVRIPRISLLMADQPSALECSARRKSRAAPKLLHYVSPMLRQPLHHRLWSSSAHTTIPLAAVNYRIPTGDTTPALHRQPG